MTQPMGARQSWGCQPPNRPRALSLVPCDAIVPRGRRLAPRNLLLSTEALLLQTDCFVARSTLPPHDLITVVYPSISQWATMLFPEEDAPLLKAWIVKRLEDTCVNLEFFASTAGSPWLTTKFATDLMRTLMSSPTTFSHFFATMAASTTSASSAKRKYPISSRKVRKGRCQAAHGRGPR